MLKEMSIEIIRKCPNYCIHCSSVSSINCNEKISFDMFKKVIDGAKNLDLKTLCFSGGEPFLHEDILEMVEYANSKGLKTYIYTSGIYIDKKGRRTSIPKFILSKLNGIVTKLIFNIESVSEENYNYIMGTRNCFQYLKQSIIDARKEDIICESHFVPMKLNINEIEDTILFCKNIGISKISFLRLVPHGRALLNKEVILLNDNELKFLKERLIELQKKYNNSIRIGVPLSGNINDAQCEAAIGKLNIKYDGYVYPCEVFKNVHGFSDSNEMPESIFNKSIEEIYDNSTYLKNIRNYINEFCQSNNCENCAGQFYIQSFHKKDSDSNVK